MGTDGHVADSDRRTHNRHIYSRRLTRCFDTWASFFSTAYTSRSLMKPTALSRTGTGQKTASLSSRAFRLELLGTRLLEARDRYNFRVIALSAVAASSTALARWISGDRNAVPTVSAYRSTRQMLGRMEVSRRGSFSIHYELMNGRSLRFEEERVAQTPFVRAPFPPMPGNIDAARPEKSVARPSGRRFTLQRKGLTVRSLRS